MKIPEPSPEEALAIAQEMIDGKIPVALMTMGAGYVHVLVRATNSDCTCECCVALREMASNMNAVIGGL